MAALTAGMASLGARAKLSRLGIWAVIAALVPVLAAYVMMIYQALTLGIRGSLIFGLATLANTLLYLLLFLSGIAILFWIHRAHANLRAAGLDNLTYSPCWAVGCWFVPLVNLVVPFKSMRELYNRSHGEGDWNANASVEVATSWWSCHIAALAILFFTTVTFLINAIPGVWLTTPPAADAGLNVAGNMLLGGSALYLRKIINAVTLAQTQGFGSASVFE